MSGGAVAVQRTWGGTKPLCVRRDTEPGERLPAVDQAGLQLDILLYQLPQGWGAWTLGSCCLFLAHLAPREELVWLGLS